MNAIMKKMPEISTEQLNSLILSIDSFNEAWGIKNLQSQHLHMNQAALNFTGIPSNFNIEGKLDHECPAPWAELAPELQDHDRRAEKTGKSVCIIETHFWNNEESIQPYFCEKFPVYNKDKQCVATVWHARKFNSLSPLELIDKRSPSALILEPPNDLFTKSELRIIFFAVNRLCCKQIAKKLELSHRTVENRLLIIYQKVGVNSLHQFITYCKNTGFDKYIPTELISKGVLFIS